MWRKTVGVLLLYAESLNAEAPAMTPGLYVYNLETGDYRLLVENQRPCMIQFD
ncbi:MAG: hypothetical protein JXN59_19620 [Anaerolineae bacterium]|nr:hypothetical protein [Anaerolineae bacterium]